ncbi:MAG: type II toxin-antitoxin system RatA family toxin [Gammaproteobacteria bacterium]|nr:type II toxin-antitoxin system RatA family toxin [Gammaproteobacteria bacterium]
MTNTADEHKGPAATYSDRRVMPYRAEQVFDLVADVERYPEFLPMWEEATIVERGRNFYHTDQVVRVGLLRTRFRSKTVLSRPRHIEVISCEGLFRRFSIGWHFAKIPGGKSCQVDCHLVWEVRSPLLHNILQLILVEAGQSIVTAFEQRADELYGEIATAAQTR